MRRRIKSRVKSHIERIQATNTPHDRSGSRTFSECSHASSGEDADDEFDCNFHSGKDHECKEGEVQSAFPENINMPSDPFVEYDDFERYFETVQYIDDDHNDTDDDDDSDDNDDNGVEALIAAWAVKHNITLSALSDIMQILHPLIPSLPKDPRTLLKTQTTYDVTELPSGGFYYHLGVKTAVVSKITENIAYATDNPHIRMQLNIDGLPLFKSTNGQFWPILGRLENYLNDEPFIIGLYYGVTKPKSVDEYLTDFVREMGILERDGFDHAGLHFDISISSVICDTPARAFVKCVKSHSGYSGCDKCIQVGRWNGKMTFPETNACARDDEAFNEMRDEDHHKDISPLSALNIGMVSQFPIDYMHLVCLGVMRRLINLWIRGPLRCRLGSNIIDQISNALVGVKGWIPREFARKPRSLREIDRWKATELRQFLLYTGPVILSGRVDDAIFKNFMLFNVGIQLLVNPSLCEQYCEYAHELLVAFVEHFSALYGDNMVVYNVHGLVHLAEDAKRFGSLDATSSFPFENFLCKIKKMVRKPDHPLQQVVRRMSEGRRRPTVNNRPKRDLKIKHHCGPVPRDFANSTQYKQVNLNGTFISTDESDRCVRVNGEIGVVRNILFHEGQIFLVYEQYETAAPFYSYPLRSDVLGILKVSGLTGHLKVANASDVDVKCVVLPFKRSYIVIPLMQHVW